MYTLIINTEAEWLFGSVCCNVKVNCSLVDGVNGSVFVGEASAGRAHSHTYTHRYQSPRIYLSINKGAESFAAGLRYIAK